jgi:hypothetical protein
MWYQDIIFLQPSKRSMKDMVGRNDGNTKVIFPAVEIPDSECSHTLQTIKSGDYIVVQVSSYAAYCIQRSILYIMSCTICTWGLGLKTKAGQFGN